MPQQKTMGMETPPVSYTHLDVYKRQIGDLLMFCQLSFPVFFNDPPDFVHSFDHKHPGIPEIVFGAIPVLEQKRIIL